MKEYTDLKNKDVHQYDFAVLELEKDAQQDFGYFGVDCRENKIESDVYLCGYLGDKKGN